MAPVSTLPLSRDGRVPVRFVLASTTFTCDNRYDYCTFFLPSDISLARQLLTRGACFRRCPTRLSGHVAVFESQDLPADRTGYRFRTSRALFAHECLVQVSVNPRCRKPRDAKHGLVLSCPDFGVSACGGQRRVLIDTWYRDFAFTTMRW
ncbi:hypothetical protein MPTK1_1g16000 [Marchantia polymorpha subsp. ruderalis]|uniref:Uncharacterized protein n=2 Tax=Marchantia polymorpha TaxID=3197 RepID=A0AAF6AQN4_MARPO|nr:hypothetical protein MARPO_0033s0060 [Marchantia polymorpha]BBM98754.1 hypothetical protein Mp_1g16000 [Marchantia polymorpha subsp. ruderalis]|eukprot:PTQ41650.1 hypothetical protein MARPO_0033s0060 [Marchantia polymorpha]